MGIDLRPIETEHAVKSVSNEVTFIQDKANEEELMQTFRDLSEQVGRRLRKASLAGTTIQIKLRWSDFTTINRQTTRSSATNLDQEIYDSVIILFKENWPKGKPIRLIGVGVTGLGLPAHQLSLWDDEHQTEASLLKAVDDLRERYGKDIIKRARQMHKDNLKGEHQEEKTD